MKYWPLLAILFTSIVFRSHSTDWPTAKKLVQKYPKNNVSVKVTIEKWIRNKSVANFEIAGKPQLVASKIQQKMNSSNENFIIEKIIFLNGNQTIATVNYLFPNAVADWLMYY